MLLPHNLYIITGANRGFGKAIAKTIAKQTKVKTSFVLVGRNQSQVDRIQFENVSCYSIGNACLSSAVEAQETVIDQLSDLIKVSKGLFYRSPARILTNLIGLGKERFGPHY